MNFVKIVQLVFIYLNRQQHRVVNLYISNFVVYLPNVTRNLSIDCYSACRCSIPIHVFLKSSLAYSYIIFTTVNRCIVFVTLRKVNLCVFYFIVWHVPTNRNELKPNRLFEFINEKKEKIYVLYAVLRIIKLFNKKWKLVYVVIFIELIDFMKRTCIIIYQFSNSIQVCSNWNELNVSYVIKKKLF